MDNSTKTGYDVLMGGITVGAVVEILPTIAAVLGIIWWCFRIYELKTIQGWIKRWKARANK